MDEITKYIWQKNTNYSFHSLKIKPSRREEVDFYFKQNGRICIISDDLDECIKNGIVNCRVDEKNFRLVLLSDDEFVDYNYEEDAFDSEFNEQLNKNTDIYVNKFFFSKYCRKNSRISLCIKQKTNCLQ